MIWRVLIFCITLGISPAKSAISADSTQVVFVTTDGWNSSRATLRLLERVGGKWIQKGATMDAVTGRNGLAWGTGLHKTPTGQRMKSEGDGCAPAGVFRFGMAFAKAKQSFAWHCVILQPTHEGVDDPKSRFYNQLVDRREIANPDWTSSEKMKASPHYGLGVWVEHNPKRIPGAGSCIYLHEWVGNRAGTAGCTLLRPKELRWLIGSLERAKKPLLVQLPADAARRYFPEFHRIQQ